MKSLGILLQPNGVSVSFGDIRNESHNEDLGKEIERNPELSHLNFNKDLMFFLNAVKMAATNGVITIGNNTRYKENVPYVCENIIVYSPREITCEQREIMNYLYSDFEKKKILIALIDKNENFEECSLDNYYEMINKGEKVKVRKNS